MMTLLVIIVSFTFIVFANALIPDYIHVCHRSDPAISKCIIRSVETLKPRLLSGIPELDIPSLEPLILPEIVINRDTDATRYKAIGRNVRVYGAGNFQVTKLKVDMPNLTFFIGIKFPFMKFLADIDINARVLLVPIKGQGELEANATNVSGNVVVKANLQEIDGITKMYFSEMNLDLKMDEVKVHLSNLFGDEILGRIINDVAKQNGRDIFNVIKPVAEQTASELILDIINKIIKSFSYDEMFPK